LETKSLHETSINLFWGQHLPLGLTSWRSTSSYSYPARTKIPAYETWGDKPHPNHSTYYFICILNFPFLFEEKVKIFNHTILPPSYPCSLLPAAKQDWANFCYGGTVSCCWSGWAFHVNHWQWSMIYKCGGSNFWVAFESEVSNWKDFRQTGLISEIPEAELCLSFVSATPNS
jgi:hypothetical protein